MEKQDVDKLELLLKTLKNLINIGEDVMEDGKIDWTDAMQVGPLFIEVKNIVVLVKAYKELGLEVTDIDGVEAARLLAILF